jgi:hypothetical protein
VLASLLHAGNDEDCRLASALFYRSWSRKALGWWDMFLHKYCITRHRGSRKPCAPTFDPGTPRPSLVAKVWGRKEASSLGSLSYRRTHLFCGCGCLPIAFGPTYCAVRVRVLLIQPSIESLEHTTTIIISPSFISTIADAPSPIHLLSVTQVKGISSSTSAEYLETRKIWFVLYVQTSMLQSPGIALVFRETYHQCAS